MPRLQNLSKSPGIYNVPGVGAIHLAPKGQPGATSEPFEITSDGPGPEVDGARRARPPLVAVLTE